MLKAKTADPDTMALVEGATTGMVATLELEGEEAVAEWEVRLVYFPAKCAKNLLHMFRL